MLNAKALDHYRHALEDTVAETGRDDIGIAPVTQPREDVVLVEFSQGSHRHTAEIPADSLSDHETMRRVVNAAILKLTKDVAQERLRNAV
jgi:hypothetical protein